MGSFMPEVVFQQCDPSGKTLWVRGHGLRGVVQAHQAADVLPALEAVQEAVGRGFYAAGYLAYEAAGGLDDSLQTHPANSAPLLWFGLFEDFRPTASPSAGAGKNCSVGPWQASIPPEEHRCGVQRIRQYIAAGDTYQVNYTFQLRAAFQADAAGFFAQLYARQRSGYSAFIDTGEQVICSVSPELFFRLGDGVLTSQPMKGTSPRGSSPSEDHRLRQALAVSEKNRAENAMIVDMLRNDIGRIAQVGSVGVSELFRIEEYPTLFQMTSTVTARTKAGFVEIVRALFPCASITGAPKVRSMQIIRELEREPRGVYTGCIGYLTPDGKAQFNVAIRTAIIHRTPCLAQYGVGGGIVWDSQSDQEHAECLAKAAILMGPC